MNGTGSSSRYSCFNRDRWSGPQIRDGVIPQHDRSVKSGGQVMKPKHPRLGLDPPRSLQEVAFKPSHSPQEHHPIVVQNAESGRDSPCKTAAHEELQHNMAEGP